MILAIQLLCEKADSLPEPYRSRAYANITDAESDLRRWPGFAGEIIADCERAINTHDLDSKEDR